MESLEIHAGERAHSGLCLASGGSLDVDIGDVTDICVTRKEREPRDVEVFEDELDIIILVLGSKCMSACDHFKLEDTIPWDGDVLDDAE